MSMLCPSAQIKTEYRKGELEKIEPIARKKAERLANKIAWQFRARTTGPGFSTTVRFMPKGKDKRVFYTFFDIDREWFPATHFAHMVKNICVELLSEKHGIHSRVDVSIGWGQVMLRPHAYVVMTVSIKP